MKYIITLLVLSCTMSVVAQDIPVDHYTGKAMINIPLVTIENRSLSHTVSLSYETSAVKVDALPGWVGQNWTLVAGGEVRRELRGLPDDFNPTSSTDYRRGWLHGGMASTIGNHSYPSDGSSLNCSTEPTEYSFINGFNNETDPEPDVFHFNAGGISGSFVFDNSGNIDNIRLIPYQDVRVKALRPNSSSPITSFEITNAAGITYVFAHNETVTRKAERFAGEDPLYLRKEYHLNKAALSFTRAWKLSNIKSPEGQVINFYYDFNSILSGPKTTVGVKKSSTADIIFKDQYKINETTDTYYLTSIEIANKQTITFNSYKVDETESQQRLLSIVLQEVNPITSIVEPVKTVYFGLTSFTSTISGDSGSKLFLTNIAINDNCETQQFKFDYFGVNAAQSTMDLPSVGSKHQDIWGYYLNNESTHSAPKLYVYPSLTGINKISLYQKTGQSDEIVIDGANRISESTPTAGVLSKIIYPSGAVASLAYESHQFLNPITNAASGGGGLRVSSVTLHDGISFSNDIVKTFQYLKSDGTTSGKLIALPSFWHSVGCYRDPETSTVSEYPALQSLAVDEQWKRLLVRTEKNLNPDFDVVDNHIVYEAVTEKTSTGKGKTVYEFSVPFTFGSAASGDWNPTYTHVARPSGCPSPALNLPGYYYAPFAPQTPYDFARGYPTKISSYAEGDVNPVKEVINEYQDKTVDPITVKAVRYEFIPRNLTNYYFMFGAYTFSTNKLKVLNRTTERVRELNGSNYLVTVTDYTYGAGHIKIASSVVTNSDGSQITNRYKYATDYGAPSATTSDLQVNMIDLLNSKGMIGTLVEQTTAVTAGGVEKTHQGTLNMFDNFGTTTYPAIRPKEVRTLFTDGITSFNMSSFSGSGSSRTFTNNGAYKKTSGFMYKTSGDLIRLENRQRQVQSIHPDNKTGISLATIANAEPDEVIYSGFDHNTDYDFDLVAFSGTDKYATGRTGQYGLAGWTSGSGKYLTKQFKKKSGAKYIFSAWYKPPVTSGSHSLNLIIKNLSGTQLASHSLSYTITSTDWHFSEIVADISGISDTDLIAEVQFGGSYSSSSTSIIDEVVLAPQGAQVARSTYKMPYGVSSSIAPDGSITEYDYNLNGRLKYVKDHNRDIVQKKTYRSFSTQSSMGPISYTFPENVVYDGDQVTFTAHTGCVEVASIQWKVAPASDPTSGSFVSGSTQFTYTFSSVGGYVVTMRVSHSSYGYYDYISPWGVDVQLRPLTVSVCVVTGLLDIDLCQSQFYQYENCDGVIDPPAQVSKANTTFKVNASGCSAGATYTYSWQTRPYGDPLAAWTPLGISTQTIQRSNLSSYDIRCVVTSSCGRTGDAYNSVFLYRSDSECIQGRN